MLHLSKGVYNSSSLDTFSSGTLRNLGTRKSWNCGGFNQIQLFSHVRPNPTGPKAKLGQGESEEKVMGRCSPNRSEGNMSSYSLQYQVAYSSQCREDKAAPQIAGRRHL